MDNRNRTHVKGISSKALFLPFIIVIIVLYIGIVFTSNRLNTQSVLLSDVMQDSGKYTSEASSIMSTSMQLSETATSFILMPRTDDGEINVGPLMQYSAVILDDPTGEQTVERFRTYDVSADVLNDVMEASECATFMTESQLHALALVTSIYKLPPVPQLEAIPIPELTEEEQALSDEEKMLQARLLILGSDYSVNKYNLRMAITDATQILNQEAAQTYARVRDEVYSLRSLLTGMTITIIIVLGIFFVLFFRLLIHPLHDFARLISSNKTLNEGSGIAEIRLVASSYNSIMARRDSLDQILLSAAETDALTSLPNRFSFERFLLSIEETGNDPIAIVLFDVNGLKKMNDTKGHKFGDILLKTSAECIVSCFGKDDEKNCFRIGGDEFAAVIRNPKPGSIDDMILLFSDRQKTKSISIAWGYASADKSDQSTVRAILDKADKQLYERKEIMHEQLSTPELSADPV